MANITIEKLNELITTSLDIDKNSRLDISATNQNKWTIYIKQGQLIWGKGNHHRFRRWYRIINHYCPEIEINSITLREKEISELWEYLFINVLLRRKQITNQQAKAVAEAMIKENLFDIYQQIDKVNKLELIQADDDTYESKSLKNPLFKNPLIYAENWRQILEEVNNQWQTWLLSGLANYSPNLAPIITQPEALQQLNEHDTYQKLSILLDGNRTLRDLALITQQDINITTKSLLVYVEQNCISFHLLPDSSAPQSNQITSTPINNPQRRLTDRNNPIQAKNNSHHRRRLSIVCIDDSAEVCRQMKQTLEDIGCTVNTVCDPIKALSTVLECKPNLIFLDLVMPVANGYEICSQIRRVQALKEIPIVILTGNDGIIDRVRAKMVGATEFVNKPISAEKIKVIARNHLLTKVNH